MIYNYCKCDHNLPSSIGIGEKMLEGEGVHKVCTYYVILALFALSKIVFFIHLIKLSMNSKIVAFPSLPFKISQG